MRISDWSSDVCSSDLRGSPLGALDQALWKAKQHLSDNDIVFQPGLNEDLAATSVWGSQQVNLYPAATHDGVFGMWYGKGPGVDRSMEVRSEEPTSALQSRMGISYDVFCLQKITSRVQRKP